MTYIQILNFIEPPKGSIGGPSLKCDSSQKISILQNLTLNGKRDFANVTM
jgi:hypothetical protein